MTQTPKKLREQQKQRQIIKLGSLLHDEWRATQ